MFLKWGKKMRKKALGDDIKPRAPAVPVAAAVTIVGLGGQDSPQPWLTTPMPGQVRCFQPLYRYSPHQTFILHKDLRRYNDN